MGQTVPTLVYNLCSISYTVKLSTISLQTDCPGRKRGVRESLPIIIVVQCLNH